jgi:hypothetical protein
MLRAGVVGTKKQRPRLPWAALVSIYQFTSPHFTVSANEVETLVLLLPSPE